MSSKLKQMKREKELRGDGILDDISSTLKKSKLLSKVSEVLAPAAGGALGGLVTANPLGAAAGIASGGALTEWLKSQGYGESMTGKGYSPQPLQLGKGYEVPNKPHPYSPTPQGSIGAQSSTLQMGGSMFSSTSASNTANGQGLGMPNPQQLEQNQKGFNKIFSYIGTYQPSLPALEHTYKHSSMMGMGSLSGGLGQEGWISSNANIEL